MKARPIFLWALCMVAILWALTLSYQLREAEPCSCPDTIRVEVPVTLEDLRHHIDAFQLECRWIPRTSSQMN